MSSNELLTKFPEALIAFLEEQIEFNWPQSDPLNQNMLTNFASIATCTNQSGDVIKYLLSNKANLFLRVIPSPLAVARVPDLVVGFLESKLDFNDSKPTNSIAYGKFLCLKFYFMNFFCIRSFSSYFNTYLIIFIHSYSSFQKSSCRTERIAFS